MKAMKDEAKAEADAAVVEAMKEPEPTREDVYAFTYAPSAVDAVYPKDYTGLARGEDKSLDRGDTKDADRSPQRDDSDIVLLCRSFASNLRASAVNCFSASSPRMRSMATMVQAVRLALHYGEEHLGVTDVFGEDVGPPLGGVFTATQGLKTAWNTPLDERGILGTAMGIAYAGGRPVCEIQFCDYAFNVIDMFKIAGNQRWAVGRRVSTCPSS